MLPMLVAKATALVIGTATTNTAIRPAAAATAAWMMGGVSQLSTLPNTPPPLSASYASLLASNSSSVVACNIYLSAGGSNTHKPLLCQLLRETQKHCVALNQQQQQQEKTSNYNCVTVVHAFRDGPYDRSSFHLAGPPNSVAEIAISLTRRAVHALLHQEEDVPLRGDVAIAPAHRPRHPTVGLIDHVSILPLPPLSFIAPPNTETEGTEEEASVRRWRQTEEEATTNRITGAVARAIGTTLTQLGADVLYYGTAHPSGQYVELAQVRRDCTTFFTTTATATATTTTPTPPTTYNTTRMGQVTVGGTQTFVENYNIRLRPGVPKHVATTLTRVLRARTTGGLPGVEALTLEYAQHQDEEGEESDRRRRPAPPPPPQYEVACNLLDPSMTSVADLQQRMRLWEQQQQQQQQQNSPNKNDTINATIISSSNLIETHYRVGTTTQMCLEALQKVSSSSSSFTNQNQNEDEDDDVNHRERSHNTAVWNQFQADFGLQKTQQQQQ